MKKRNARRRLDEMRVWSGQPQLTHFKLKRISHKAYKAKWHLCHAYGYREDPRDPYTLLYDEHTDRREKVLRKNGHEEYYTKRYHLRFKAAGVATAHPHGETPAEGQESGKYGKWQRIRQ